MGAVDGETWYYTTVQYDTLDRRMKVYRQDHTTSFNSYVQYDYTGCGCAGSTSVTVTDERGKKRKTVSDHLGRLKEADDLTAGGAIYSRAAYTYNELNQMTKIEHYNNSTAHQDRTFAFDGYGRVQSQTTPEAGVVTYTYKPNDFVETLTDARSVVTTFGYNKRRLLTSVRYNDTGANETPDAYYDYGEYDERLWMEEKLDNNTVKGRTDYGYNTYKQVTSETRDFKSISGTYKVEYAWNKAGGLNRYTTTVNAWVKNVSFGWNYAGASTGVGTNIIGSDPDTTSNIAGGLQYVGFGAVRAMNYGTNPRKLAAYYDLKRQQVTGLVVKRTNDTDTIMDLGYNYYNGGNGRSNGRIQQVGDAVDTAYTTTYTYDDYQRLTNASATAYTRAYSYDAWANQTGVTVTGPSETGTYSMSHATNASGAPATNRIQAYVGVTTLGYDNAGNQTFDGWQSHTYDAASRLKTALNASSSYEYDGDGGRVKQTNGGGTIYYLRSSVLGDVVAEINGGSSTLYRAYVRSAMGQALAVQSYYGDFYWIHSDHLGSAKKHTDSSGNVTYSGQFDPYGQAVSEWQQSSETYKHSRKFTGYERDWATNLDYANARTYDFRRARFMQPDPLGLGASDLSAPQSLNLYAYVENDPVNLVDPTGLEEANPDPWWYGLALLIHFGKLLNSTPEQPMQGIGGSSENTQKGEEFSCKDALEKLEINLADASTEEGSLARLLFQEAGGGSWEETGKAMTALTSIVYNRAALLNKPGLKQGETLGFGSVGASVMDVIYSTGKNPNGKDDMGTAFAGFTSDGIANSITNRLNNTLNGSPGDDCVKLMAAIGQAKLAVERGQNNPKFDPFGAGKTFGVRTAGSRVSESGFIFLGTLAGQDFYGLR